MHRMLCGMIDPRPHLSKEELEQRVLDEVGPVQRRVPHNSLIQSPQVLTPLGLSPLHSPMHSPRLSPRHSPGGWGGGPGGRSPSASPIPSASDSPRSSGTSRSLMTISMMLR